jgi:membrane-associated phospholipid phosphatase
MTTAMTTAFQRVEASSSSSLDYGNRSGATASTQPPFRWNKSRKEIYQDSIGFLLESPRERILELVLSYTCLILGYAGPEWWTTWRNDTAWRERISVPYQETANGDVLIQLGLHYDVQDETVPVWMLLLLTLVLPILLLPLITAFFGPPGDAHAILCVYGWAVGLNWLISDVLKVYCGQLRPNFYALCEFDADTKTCLNESSYNAYKSFPSGHSSLAFCSMTIVSLHWLGKVGILRSSRSGSSLRTKLSALVAFLLPTSIAIWIAASRIHDHYHHPVDVVTGAAIGTMCAHFCMALYYPSIYATGSLHRGDEVAAGYPLLQSPQGEEAGERQEALPLSDVDDLPSSSTRRMNPTSRDTNTIT